MEQNAPGSLPEFTIAEARKLAALAEQCATSFEFLDELRKHCQTICQIYDRSERASRELTQAELLDLLENREKIISENDPIQDNDKNFDDFKRIIRIAAVEGNSKPLIDIISINKRIQDGFIDFPVQKCMNKIIEIFARPFSTPYFKENYDLDIEFSASDERLEIIYDIFNKIRINKPKHYFEAAAAIEIFRHLSFDIHDMDVHEGLYDIISDIIAFADEMAGNHIPFHFSSGIFDGVMGKFSAGPSVFPEAWVCEWVSEERYENPIWLDGWHKIYTREEAAKEINTVIRSIVYRNWLSRSRELAACVASIYLFRVLQLFGHLGSEEHLICEFVSQERLCDFSDPQELFLRVLREQGDPKSQSDVRSLRALENALNSSGLDTSFIHVQPRRAEFLSPAMISRDARAALEEYRVGAITLHGDGDADARTRLVFQGILQRLSVAFEKETIARAKKLKCAPQEISRITLDGAISAIEGYLLLGKAPRNVTPLRRAQNLRNVHAHEAIVHFNAKTQADNESQFLDALEWLTEFDGA